MLRTYYVDGTPSPSSLFPSRLAGRTHFSMSGRLVILPHKRWNVWNQDNVEKVLRDERLERERLDRERVRERRAHQDASYSALTGREGAAALPALAEPSDWAPKNEDAEREKKEAELLRMRREGVAPWALGEGVVEKLRRKPWQFSAPGEGGFPEDEVRRGRDDRRKASLDPMAAFSRGTAGGGKSESEHRQRRHPPGDGEDVIGALRRKRLEREAVERKRARELLASVEEDGSPSVEGYHEQFNRRRKHSRVAPAK